MKDLNALIPLDKETRAVLPSKLAAPHLGLTARTLTAWAQGKGKPQMQPVRVGRRVLWRVADIRQLLGV